MPFQQCIKLNRMGVKFKLKCFSNKQGLTLVEIIMTFAVLGVVICPLMTMFVISQNISNYINNEYKSMLLAQKYVEEIESMKEFDIESYKFNCDTGYYEKDILQNDNGFTAKIKIIPDGSILYNIEVDVWDSNGEINKIESSKIFY